MKKSESVIKRNLRCLLTDEEKLASGKELAEASTQMRQIAEDKQRVVKDFGSRLSACEATISVLSNKIATGYEFRDVDCRIEFNEPKAGRKTVVRLDTAEKVNVEDMTADEMQEKLNFTPKESA